MRLNLQNSEKVLYFNKGELNMWYNRKNSPDIYASYFLFLTDI